MKNIKEPYFLGLDIGTESVGWAITDINYKLKKKNGKTLWGIRQFEGGKTAEERRINRSSRRRLERKKARIKLLQEIFSDEINKIDPDFFMRIEESKYIVDDKHIYQWNTLFNDKNYKDKDYHEQYPTIYHLRKKLIDSNEKFDIRLIYLAIAHIVKNRGHFLMEGQEIETVDKFDPVFNDMCNVLKDNLDVELIYFSLEEISEIIKSKEIGKREKFSKLKSLISSENIEKDSILKLLCGSKVELGKIFINDNFDEAEIKKITFSDASYGDNYIQLENQLQDKICIIDKIKMVYDWAILTDILGGESYLSLGKLKTYEKHKEDLKKLKISIKILGKETYKKVFSEAGKTNNYSAYIGMTKKNGKKQVIEKRCTQEEFYQFLKKILKDIPENNILVSEILCEIEQKTFLPKQKNSENGIIPYQVHLKELKLILMNAAKHYKFLNEESEGFSTKDKIVQIFNFRIPYYVGPLNDAHKENGGNAWIVKKDITKKIRPWNFEDVVDIEATAEAFITRMTNKCTYLVGEDVLPKNSILYSKFILLNELNNLKINGEPIAISLKKSIINDLFKRYKKVNQKKLKSYLISEGIVDGDPIISGIDGDFKGNLSSYIDMHNILGNNYNEGDAEELIRWITLFGDDKKILKQRIKKSKIVVTNKVYTLKYAGWGRLSKELLTDITHVNKFTGEIRNIMAELMETNNNFMQLLSYSFDFMDGIEEYNVLKNDIKKELTYDILDDLYVSPAVKRSIWQTLRIVKEIIKISGYPPEKIFIEMARSKEERKRTISRKKSLEDLYKNCKEESVELIRSLGEKSEGDLRSKRLYLYYTQMGRCLYTGKRINLEQLFNANIYDVDHIYPQSKVKDDSIQNMVLVERTANSKKSNKYPLPKEYRQPELWKQLFNKKFIGKTKFERLMRTTDFTDGELANFIARQLVETRQSTKVVAGILKKVFNETNIVYVKAGNVSNFRHKYDLIKVREINDFHHAKDAYLNIVVGNVYDTKFTQNPLKFIQSTDGRNYNISKIFNFNLVKNGRTAWKAENSESITHIKNTMKTNQILVTRYAVEKKGLLFDQQIKRKSLGEFPIKGGDNALQNISQYGGYKSIKTGYFFLVEHIKKSNTVKTIEFVPIYLLTQINSTEDLLLYSKEKLGLKSPRILLEKIKVNTLFNVDGFLMYLSGRQKEQLKFKHGLQLILNYESEEYIKKICKFVDRNKQEKGKLCINEYDKIDFEKNINLYDLFYKKLSKTTYAKRFYSQIKILETGRAIFSELSLENQCIVIFEILKLFQCNPVTSNFKLINGPKDSGALVMNKDITKLERIKIINQSVTGIFSNEMDLNTL